MNLQTKVHKSWGDFKEPSQLLGPSLIYRYLYLFVFSSGASKGMKRVTKFFSWLIPVLKHFSRVLALVNIIIPMCI